MSTSSLEREDESATLADESEPLVVDGASSIIREDRKVIFINLVVLDASNAIDQQLSKKLKGRVARPLVKAATAVATTLATPERVAAALAADLPKQMVDKMASKGLTAAAELTFLEGPYVVVQLQIQAVSPAAMIEAQSKDSYNADGQLEVAAQLGQDWAARLQACLASVLALIGVHRQKSLEQEYLPRLVQSKMETVMGDIMAGKLQDKGLQAVSQVLPEDKQARFFFGTLRELRASRATPKYYKVARAVAVAKSGVQGTASTAARHAKTRASTAARHAKKAAADWKEKFKFPGKKGV